MVRVCVEMREEDELFDVAVYADSIGQAIARARERFPGHDIRVVFPIDGQEFFGGGGTEQNGTKDGGQPRLLSDRVS